MVGNIVGWFLLTKDLKVSGFYLYVFFVLKANAWIRGNAATMLVINNNCLFY